MEHCLSFLITGTCRRGRNCHEDHPTITHGNRTIVMLRGYYKVDSKEINEAKLKRFIKVADREARAFGPVLDVAVAVNSAEHLRGNVYLNFADPNHAVAAARSLSGRPLADYEATVHACVTLMSDLLAGRCKNHVMRKLYSCTAGRKCDLLHLEREDEENHKELCGRRRCKQHKRREEIELEEEPQQEAEEQNKKKKKKSKKQKKKKKKKSQKNKKNKKKNN